MRVVKFVSVEDLEQRGSIKGSDVTKLARAFAHDPHISEDEAEVLLRLNRSCPIQAPSWRGLLVDLIADYILNHSGPEGYITSEKSAWLIARLSSNGWIGNRAEFDLMVSILRRARWFPLSLATFVLEQVAGAAIHGFGPLRSGPASLPGTIGDAEIGLIRTVLTAFGGESALALTRPEAEVLLAINTAVAVRGTTPAWADFFAKALANALLAEHGFAVPPRAVALRPGAAADGELALAEQVALSLEGLDRDYHRQTGEERALARLEWQRIEIVTGESLPSDVPAWLTDRLVAGFRRTPLEGLVVARLAKDGFLGDASLARDPARDGKAA